MTDRAQHLSVVIAVVTFRRPDDLAVLLASLLEQAASVGAEPAVDVEILIVDNDPVGSAEPVVRALDSPGVSYVREPEPGIAAARNRALAETIDVDLLVFIDDDERPAEEWLAQLLTTWRSTGAAAVTGPVESRLPSVPEPWIVAGAFFERMHRQGTATGTELASAATNNLLLDRRVVRSAALLFDSAFGISGGEDELFTRRLRAAGARIVWCAEALVYDEVRPERINRAWLLLRAFSYGSIDSRIAVTLAGTPARRGAARLRCMAMGVPRVLFGVSRWWFGMATGSLRHSALGRQTMMRGCGLIAGAAGRTHDRYARSEIGSSFARQVASPVGSERAGT